MTTNSDNDFPKDFPCFEMECGKKINRLLGFLEDGVFGINQDGKMATPLPKAKETKAKTGVVVPN